MRPSARIKGTLDAMANDWFKKWWGTGRDRWHLRGLCDQPLMQGLRIARHPRGGPPTFHGLAAQPGMEDWLACEAKDPNLAHEPNWVAFNKAVRGRMHLQYLLETHRNHRRIADVAEDLLKLQDKSLIDPFHYDKTGDWKDVETIDDIVHCRYLNCFEFVFLCGWIAGSQSMTLAGGTVPKIHTSGGAVGAYIFSTKSGEPTLSSKLRFAHEVEGGTYVLRHKTVYSTVPGRNDPTNGLYHCGIATGNGTMVHLNSMNVRLARQAIDWVFVWQWGYGNVFESDYLYL